MTMYPNPKKTSSPATKKAVTELSYVSALLIGLAGSVHCVGMCGGIVGAFSFILPKDQNPWAYMLSYNLGRITSYAIAGALTGWLGNLVTTQVSMGFSILNLLSGLFLLLLALYIGGWWRVLVHLESLGRLLWNRISPIAKHFLPFRSPLQAFPYGVVWGWLPCGLVYSTLTWSLASGSPLDGALVMVFFGMGTLPALLTLSGSGNALKTFLSNSRVRKWVALSLLIFALIFIYQAIHNALGLP